MEVPYKPLVAEGSGCSSRVVFLGFSTNFDKVIHSALLFKLCQLAATIFLHTLMQLY